MNSLFTVDESALQKAFGMDGSSLNGLSDALALPSSMNLQDTFTLDGGSMNLSGMVDLSQVNLDVSDMPEFNLGDMLSHLDITMKPGGMEKMIQILNEGYSEYVKSHPEADYSTLGEHFSEYLTTDDAKNIIRKYLGSILQQNGDVVITTAQMQNLITRVMTGMQSYVQGRQR